MQHICKLEIRSQRNNDGHKMSYFYRYTGNMNYNYNRMGLPVYIAIKSGRLRLKYRCPLNLLASLFILQ